MLLKILIDRLSTLLSTPVIASSSSRQCTRKSRDEIDYDKILFYSLAFSGVLPMIDELNGETVGKLIR